MGARDEIWAKELGDALSDIREGMMKLSTLMQINAPQARADAGALLEYMDHSEDKEVERKAFDTLRDIAEEEGDGASGNFTRVIGLVVGLAMINVHLIGSVAKEQNPDFDDGSSDVIKVCDIQISKDDIPDDPKELVEFIKGALKSAGLPEIPDEFIMKMFGDPDKALKMKPQDMLKKKPKDDSEEEDPEWPDVFPD